MGKNNKAQKPAKGAKDGFSLSKVADTVHQQKQDTNETSGDVIAGFDFLKNFVSDDAMGDSPISVCLRKMAKKDAMTKIKALQDFIELVNNPETDINPCLQFWSRCYCRLTMCGDHRVRELAQNALSAVISKSGRQFAPCLKIVIPYCMLSHVDCVATVANAAKSCLETSFNESRRIQAILMCKLPIFELISSVIKFTNPYLADKSLGLDEEEVLRRDRLLSACLGVWSVVAMSQQPVESGAVASSDSEEPINGIIADILSSLEFDRNILKSDSQLILSALHVWIVTLCQYCPSVVKEHSKLFISTIFLTPQNEGELAASRIVDVGSWQSAAALLKVTTEDPFWTQSNFDKQFAKKLNSLLANGPAYFLPPPTPFFAVQNIPVLTAMNEAIMTILKSHFATLNDDSTLKFMKRFTESSLQGFQKVKPFHSRHQELTVFCETITGAFLVLVAEKPNFDLDTCFEGSLKLFSNLLKLDSSCCVAILPHFATLFANFLTNFNKFQNIFTENLLRHVQFLATGPESMNESTNFASFFNLFSKPDEKISSIFAKIVCSAMSEMRTSGNIFAFLCSLSPNLVSSFANCKELQLETKRLLDETIENHNDEIALKLLLNWDFLISDEDLSRLLNILCQNVKNLQDLADLLSRLSPKFRSNEHIVTIFAKLLSQTDVFFDSPRLVANLLFTICEKTKILHISIANLLERVSKEFLRQDSSFYLGKIVQEGESTTQNSNSPVEILTNWLEKREDLRGKSNGPKEILACFSEIFQKIGSDLALSDETLQNCVAIQTIFNCYNLVEGDLLVRYKTPRFLAILRDVLLYDKSNFSLLLPGICEIFAGNFENAVFVENLSSFSRFIDDWLLSNCITSTVIPNPKATNDNCQVDLHLKDLICTLIAQISSEKSSFEFVVEAVSVVELVASSSWLSVQLLEFVDEMVLSLKNEQFLVKFVAYCRNLPSLKMRLAFSYLLNGRHPKLALERVIDDVTKSLLTNFNSNSFDDLWLLSETVNRSLRTVGKLTEELISLLKIDFKQQNLRLFAQLSSSLGGNFCEQVTFDEELTKNHEISLRENAKVDLKDADFMSSLDSTADLAVFFDYCLRYTPKLTSSIDSILCSVCSWISTAKNVVIAIGDLTSFQKIRIARFLVAISECCHTIHKAFSSSRTFKFQPSDQQKSEFAEFYQLQYLDALIQLVMSLWLPSSFFLRVLKNQTVQDRINFAIVSCLHKASSVDVIAHVHLEPLFCAEESYLPEDVQTIIGRLSPLITDQSIDDVRVHLATYTVLATLNPSLSGIYLSLSNEISQQRDNDDDFVLTPPRVWLREIAELTESVSLAVASDTWRNHPEPISGYLYVWLLVLRLAGSLPSEVRPPMVNFLRKSPDFQALLLNVFALAPANPQLVDPAPFDSLPQLTNTSEAVPLVGHLACFMIRELLATIPAVVRSWLNDQIPSLRRDIVSYVSTFLSPSLRAVELSKVRQAEFDEAIKIRVMTATGELVATYQGDQVRLDLTVTLPDDYPLSAPTIECKQNILSSTCKLWLRQLTALLICQNGEVLDALLLWQKLITEKLGKIEECTICYSIVQGGNLNLPRRQCRTCKKRFHSACLFKWFESSGNVTCPLCREQFY